MGHGGYTLEFSLKDSVSAGLKDMAGRSRMCGNWWARSGLMSPR